MKIYNKTTRDLHFGFVVPAATHEGDLGEGVEITPEINNIIRSQKTWQGLLAARHAGAIEIAE